LRPIRSNEAVFPCNIGSARGGCGAPRSSTSGNSSSADGWSWIRATTVAAMKQPATVHAVLRHQQHFLLVALLGLIASPEISVVAARSLRQGFGVTIAEPVQESSPAEEEEAEEALADDEAVPPTNTHGLAFVSRERYDETQPPTPLPAPKLQSAPPAPMPESILAPPPFAAPMQPPFAAPGLLPVPAPMLAPLPAPMLAPAPGEMASPFGPDVPLVQANESIEERPTTTTATTTTTTMTTTTTIARTTTYPDHKKANISAGFKNIDYNALTANKALLDDFKQTVREDIAEKIGHGVTPDDVEIQIRPGSVVVDATVTVPEGSIEDVESVRREACSSASSLADEIAKDVSAIDGISNAVSGTVQGEVIGACALSSSTPTTTTSSSTTAKVAVVEEDDEDDMEACHPTCIKDQGVCSDKVCFCKSPFTGIRCERIRKSASARLSYTLAAGIAAFGLFAGVVIGVIFFASVVSPKMKQSAAVPEKKAETWQAG